MIAKGKWTGVLVEAVAVLKAAFAEERLLVVSLLVEAWRRSSMAPFV